VKSNDDNNTVNKSDAVSKSMQAAEWQECRRRPEPCCTSLPCQHSASHRHSRALLQAAGCRGNQDQMARRRQAGLVHTRD
jgi:hypothetical protein